MENLALASRNQHSNTDNVCYTIQNVVGVKQIDQYVFKHIIFQTLKLQPINWRSTTLLEKEFERCLAESIPKREKQLSCRIHSGTYDGVCV